MSNRDGGEPNGHRNGVGCPWARAHGSDSTVRAVRVRKSQAEFVWNLNASPLEYGSGTVVGLSRRAAEADGQSY